MSSAEEWKRRWSDARKDGGTIVSAEAWTRIVDDTRRCLRARQAERLTALAAEETPQNGMEPYERPLQADGADVVLPPEVVLGLEAQIAELEYRLALLKECGAVEWALQQRTSGAAARLRRHLEERARVDAAARRVHLHVLDGGDIPRGPLGQT